MDNEDQLRLLGFENDKYVTVMLNDFLFNAGVLGLLKIFQYANEKTDIECVKGEDYIIDGQKLLISKSFLNTKHIAQLYVDALVDTFKDDTKFTRVMNQKTEINCLYEKPLYEDKGWCKKVTGLFKEFSDMLLKSSFKTAYDILKDNKDIKVPTVTMIDDFKNEKDLKIKKQKYDDVHNIISQKQVSDLLIFKDLLYTKINMFYADNKGNGAAFFSNSKVYPAIAFHEKFVQPLLDMLNNSEKIKQRSDISCINCGCETTKKDANPISIFVDQADDLNRKKSYYWNCNGDAYLCPLCSFVCALSPLGFSYLGADGVFINNNSSIELLKGFDAMLHENAPVKGELPSYYKLYNIFTSKKLSLLKNTLNNIQVVVRDKNSEKYRLTIIDKKTVEIFDNSSKQLSFIKTKFVKNGESYLNVYLETVDNILKGRNQFLLINKLMKIALSSGENASYLFSILQVQIYQKGGVNMAENIKKAYATKMIGQELRNELTKDLPMEADKENKLRGLVYQMLNAVSIGNRDKFMEIVIRTYSSCNRAVPNMFFSCFGSDEEFKEIGFAFLLGLKSSDKSKEDKVQ